MAERKPKPETTPPKRKTKKIPVTHTKSSPKQRKYSDEEKAEVLAALKVNGGNIKLTTIETGVPWATIKQWSVGLYIHPTVIASNAEKLEALDKRLENLSHQLCGAIPGKMDEATLQQTAVSLGILIDKMRLLREQSTSISGKAETTDDELLEQLRRLAAQRIRRGIPPQENQPPELPPATTVEGDTGTSHPT